MVRRALPAVFGICLLGVVVWLAARSTVETSTAPTARDGHTPAVGRPVLLGAGSQSDRSPAHVASEPSALSISRGHARLLVLVRWPDGESGGRSARVTVRFADGSMRSAATDTEGRVEFGLAVPGCADLWAAAESPYFGLDDCVVGDEGDSRVRLRLHEGAVIVGRVLDARTGAPVEGAMVGVPWRIEAWSGGRSGPGVGVTDAHGEYEAWWVLRSRTEWYEDVSVAALARGYALEVVPFPKVGSDGQRVHLDFQLQPGGTARGAVTRPDGTPGRGARVTLLPQVEDRAYRERSRGTSSPSDTVSVHVTRADAAGRYELLGLPLDTGLAAVAEADGYARSVEIRDLVPTSSRPDVSADLVLRQAARIWILVLDEDEDPVMGAEVLIDVGPQPAWRETDEHGVVEKEGLTPGTHRVRVRAHGCPLVSQTVEARPGELTKVKICVNGGVEIAGVFLDGSGRLVAGAWVDAWAVGSGMRGSARTDEDGHFRITGLAPGPYELRARDHHRTALPCEKMVVEAPVGTARLVLQRCVCIRVHLTVPGGAEPPLWLEVSYPDHDTVQRRRGRRSADAHAVSVFFCDVPAGRRTFRFTAPGFAPVERTLDVPGVEAAFDVEVVLDRGRELKGRVVDLQGRPIADAAVQVFDRQGLDVETDVGGHFTLSQLAAEPIRIRVDADDRVSVEREYNVGKDSEPLLITLYRGAVLRGRVVDETGCGVPQCEVSIRLARDPDARSYMRWQMTDEIGAFRMRVAAGHYVVGIERDDTFVPMTEVALDEEGGAEVELLVPSK